MAYVDGGNFLSVVVASEATYITVDFHLRAVGCKGKTNVVPFGADRDIPYIATAHYLYGRARRISLKVKIYRRSVFDGKGDVTFHIYFLCRHSGTREKPYREDSKKENFSHK